MDVLILKNLQHDLKALLEEHVLKKTSEDEIDVSFAAPDKEFISALGATPTINCYLIGVDEDKKRRQSEPLRTKLNGPTKQSSTEVIQTYKPRFIDVSYMLTVWSRDKNYGAEIEHLMLGYLICGLGAVDLFPGVKLSAPKIEPSLYGIRMQLFGSEYAEKISGQVWQAMGSTPKPCIMLSLSVPVGVREPVTRPIIREIDRATSNIAKFGEPTNTSNSKRGNDNEKR